MISRICLRSTNLTLSRRVLSSSVSTQAKEGVRSAQGQVDDWYSRNAKTNRPMSPHLSVYAWTIPMAMSSANRIFAFALVFGFLLFPVIDILGSGDVVADIAGFSKSMRETSAGTAGIMVLKAAIFYPFFYHTFLGFRHWSWDIFALGIRNVDTLYTTGYIALAASAVFTVAFCLYHNSE